MTLKFLAEELSLSVEDVESLLVDMILDNRVIAYIDQIKGFVTLGNGRESVETKTLKSLSNWSDILRNVTDGIADRIS